VTEDEKDARITQLEEALRLCTTLLNKETEARNNAELRVLNLQKRSLGPRMTTDD